MSPKNATYLLHCKSVTTCTTCPNVISITKFVIVQVYIHMGRLKPRNGFLGANTRKCIPFKQ